MHPNDLLDMVEEGESTRLEFKRKINKPERIAKEIAAFANTIGGYIFIGIDDDGSIVGVNSEKTEINIIETACEFHIEPPVLPKIEIVNVYGNDVIVVFIPESKKKPHTLTVDDKEKQIKLKRAYIRVGEKSVMASREMYRLLTYHGDNGGTLKLSIGEHEKRLFAYLELHERATVNDFSRLVNISRRRAERLMIRLVRAGLLQIHNESTTDYFTLIGE